MSSNFNNALGNLFNLFQNIHPQSGQPAGGLFSPDFINAMKSFVANPTTSSSSPVQVQQNQPAGGLFNQSNVSGLGAQAGKSLSDFGKNIGGKHGSGTSKGGVPSLIRMK